MVLRPKCDGALNGIGVPLPRPGTSLAIRLAEVKMSSSVKRFLSGALVASAAVACVAVPAYASGGSGGGGSSSGSAPACATIDPLPLYTFGNGTNQRFVVQANVTNCGTTQVKYATKATDVSVSHTNPLCAINTSSYGWTSALPGASQYFWQASGSGVCIGEHYDIRIDVTSNNTVIASTTVSIW